MRDLRRDLAPHLAAKLAQAVVDRLQSRMLLRELERQVVAFEQELDLRRLQLREGRVRGVDDDALRARGSLGGGQAASARGRCGAA
jgi:hypothetical protein